MYQIIMKKKKLPPAVYCLLTPYALIYWSFWKLQNYFPGELTGMYLTRFAMSCSISNGNTFETAFKYPNRVVFWERIKLNSYSLSLGICLHMYHRPNLITYSTDSLFDLHAWVSYNQIYWRASHFFLHCLEAANN